MLAAVADLARELLESCRPTFVLATSREPLRLAGETVRPVPTLSAGDAATLFVERGQQVRPGFGPDPAEASAVETLCARLDGLPLAVELEAAWLSTLTAPQIEAELDDRFALLIRGPRGVVARHETLLASMSWSHDMLSPDDQAVFQRLSVLAAGITASAPPAA